MTTFCCSVSKRTVAKACKYTAEMLNRFFHTAQFPTHKFLYNKIITNSLKTSPKDVQAGADCELSDDGKDMNSVSLCSINASLALSSSICPWLNPVYEQFKTFSGSPATSETGAAAVPPSQRLRMAQASSSGQHVTS